MNPLGNLTQGLTTRYDMGEVFRRQEPRSLEDIDRLVQRQQQLRLTIGLERAAYVESNPELFADGEKFRIFHAEARWNAFFFTIASYIGGVGAINMFMPQLQARKMIKQYQPLVAIGVVGYAMLSYQVFSRLAGFDPSNWNEYNYAKSVRMLRNVQIKQ